MDAGRFLVEQLEAAREKGLNTYGAYCVLAAEEVYLTAPAEALSKRHGCGTDAGK